MNVPLSSPNLTSREKQIVLEVLNTPNLSLGPKLSEFEDRFSDYTGCKYAIAVNSGTSGLHLCIKALDIGKGDQVITTPFSFIASANCILFEQATPVFVDIDPDSYNIAVDKIEEKITRTTRALLPVHVFGQPCEMDKMTAIAQAYNLTIIEDACEAIGAEYYTRKTKFDQNFENQAHANFAECETGTVANQKEMTEKPGTWRKLGTFGACGVFAFYPNKQITTGEGGMIVTNDEKIASLCKSLRNQGRGDDGRSYIHERLGYNYRLSEINCALGIVQLQRIDDILSKRARVAGWYQERLQEIPEIRVPSNQPNCRISWFVFVIRLAEEFPECHRNKIIDELTMMGIGCNKYFQPIHLQPFYVKMFGYQRGDFPMAEHAADHTIALPFFTHLEEDQVDYVCAVLKKILKKLVLKKYYSVHNK